MTYGANDIGYSDHSCMLCGKALLASKAVVVGVGGGLKLMYDPHCADSLSESIQEHKQTEKHREEARVALKAAIKNLQEEGINT